MNMEGRNLEWQVGISAKSKRKGKEERIVQINDNNLAWTKDYN